MGKFMLSRLSWVEAREAAAQKRVVILPVGTLENQSLHNLLGYDAIVAERLGEAAARRTDSLVAPTIPYGCSQLFRDYPGTVVWRFETLAAVLRDTITSFRRHGFSHILLLNNHFPNEPAVEVVARELRETDGTLIASIIPHKLARDLGKDLYVGHADAVVHGSDPGTSLMLYLVGEDMRMDAARTVRSRTLQGFEIESPNAVKFQQSSVNMYMDMQDMQPIGGTGDALFASKEKGETIFNRMVDFVADFITRFKKMDPRLRTPVSDQPE
ncbi:MAG TPA: creatininase family protein [Candidatus Methylomirabilis sp.]|nr:creatininase family protein [Candidatus Methylomirabilis sp.]